MIEAFALCIRGILAFCLLGCGFYALRQGLVLVQSRNNGKEKANIRFLGFETSTNSIGALVMMTACVWGITAWQAAPKFQRDMQGVRVTQSIDPINSELDALVQLLRDMHDMNAAGSKLAEHIAEVSDPDTSRALEDELIEAATAYAEQGDEVTAAHFLRQADACSGNSLVESLMQNSDFDSVFRQTQLEAYLKGETKDLVVVSEELERIQATHSPQAVDRLP